MHDDERSAPIDLSALDPSLDAVRWERRIQALAARAAAAARPPVGPLHAQLLSWGRPALALAAVLALAIWGATILGFGARARPTGAVGEATPAAEATTDRVSSLARWAERDGRPSTTELLAILGEKP